MAFIYQASHVSNATLDATPAKMEWIVFLLDLAGAHFKARLNIV